MKLNWDYCCFVFLFTILIMPVVRGMSILTTTSNSFLPFRSSLQIYQKCFPRISEPQLDQLDDLCHRIYDWNSKVNLISRKDVDSLVDNHVLPSLAISLVKSFNAKDTVIDVGTGGGFPGLPMAILFPNVEFTLLDSNAKKMKIVIDIVSQMGLKNVRVVTGRAESLLEHHDYILGRAVSALPTFLSYSSHFLKQDGSRKEGIFYIKGGDFTAELRESKVNNLEVVPISKVIAGLASDKNILVIPRHEVLSFQARNK